LDVIEITMLSNPFFGRIIVRIRSRTGRDIACHFPWPFSMPELTLYNAGISFPPSINGTKALAGAPMTPASDQTKNARRIMLNADIILVGA